MPYLNYHRPCYFSKEEIDNKGTIRKTYPYDLVMTPYEKLRSLPNATAYLKPRVNFFDLDKDVMKLTDLEAAKIMKREKEKLFSKIFSE